MKIVVHIGWHKTGTTSIQQLLLRNKNVLAEEFGVLYPEAGLLEGAHHLIPWAYIGKRESPWGAMPVLADGPRKFIDDAMAESESRSCQSIILSSEEFCTLSRQQIEMFGECMQAVFTDISIVAYIRRQDRIVESSYNMEVKWWGTRSGMSFSEYVVGKEAYPNFWETLKNWADVFGARSLIVRHFEKKQFANEDVRQDFLSSIRLELPVSTFPTENANDSLGPKTLEFVRLMNQLKTTRRAHDETIKSVMDWDKKNNTSTCVLFSPEDRAAFMAHCDAENERLSELGIDCTPLKLAASDFKEPNVKQLSVDEFDLFWRLLERRA